MHAESEEFPWPKPGDTLFRSDDDPQSDAWLNWALTGWDAYASGYLAAANLLLEAVFEKEQRADTLIYPVAFLYRHYLELRLKEIIVQGGELLAHQSDLKPVHKLDVLWNSVRLILEKVWPNGPKTDLDAVENVIRQFHNLDLTSIAFRYPVDRNNNATLSGLTQVGPRNLRDVMQRTAGLLEASSSAISMYLDEMRDRDSY
jgi:hypothetical protein